MSRLLDQGFLIRPLEAVYFGRPQSFSAGEAHHGSSEFPPSGYAFQGMVRSQLLRAAQPALDLDDGSRAARQQRAGLVGEPDALPTGWQLTGPYPARVVVHDGERYLEPWLPTPRFLLGEAATLERQALPNAARLPTPCCPREEAAQPSQAIAMPRQPATALNDLGGGTVLLGRADRRAVKPLTGWINPSNLRYALSAGHPQRIDPWCREGYARRLPPFVHREPRPGLALEHGVARHGMLYFLNTLRFADGAGFYGHFSGLCDNAIPGHALSETLGAAGRKERPAAFEAAAPLTPDFIELCAGRHLPDVVEEAQCFWLTTLTPVALADPAVPIASEWHGVRIDALGLLTGPPLTMGGYRYADATTRPNRSYLPAGSCWLIRLRGADPTRRARALRALHNAHVLGASNEAAFGFGHTVVGLAANLEENP